MADTANVGIVPSGAIKLHDDEDVGLLERLLSVWMEFRQAKRKDGMGAHAYNLIALTFNTKIKPRLKEQHGKTSSTN